MGKPELKSVRHKNGLTLTCPLTRSKSTPLISSANIRVVVRVRPLNEKENENRVIIKLVNEQLLIFDPKINITPFFYRGVEQRGRDLLRKANKDLQFTFDRVFGYEATNQEVFQSTTQKLIKALMDGYNCSVFAYGATGAGKTHTMIGSSENPGITFLTMAELFKAREELSEERNFDLSITYLEVYNEQVLDLLSRGRPLELREDRHGVTVAGIKVHKIKNSEDLFTLLEQGNGNRTQHPTDANAESSRSHAVFQVYIQMETKTTHEARSAKLSMIDLAGSERGSVTGFGGARFAEGANINKSLLALGNCINSLADGQKYVPYRDSKLTRLLKDSLGGNCQTIMIANISPAYSSFEDTYNTLKYAARAKKIKSNVTKNVISVELHSGEYMKVVEDLKKELEKVKKENERIKFQLKSVESKSHFTTDSVDPAVVKELMDLIEQRKKLMARKYNVQSSGHMYNVKRRLKEDADRRVSLLMITPDKREAHKRLGNLKTRLQRQEDALASELEEICDAKKGFETKCTELLESHPELEKVAELEEEKLAKKELEYQLDLKSRKATLQEAEMQHRTILLEKACRLLRPCYTQLKGHGFITESLASDYQSLINDLQDRQGISFNFRDSGLGSTSASSSETEIRATKRKVNEDDLDQTYVLEADNRAKVQGCTEELITKVANSDAGGKKKALVPLKENKVVPSILAMKKSPQGMKRSLHRPDLSKRRPFRT